MKINERLGHKEEDREVEWRFSTVNPNPIDWIRCVVIGEIGLGLTASTWIRHSAISGTGFWTGSGPGAERPKCRSNRMLPLNG
jgi:hypothetical protein